MKKTSNLAFFLLAILLLTSPKSWADKPSRKWVALNSKEINTTTPLYDIRVNTQTKCATETSSGVIFVNGEKHLYIDTHTWKYNFSDRAKGSKEYKKYTKTKNYWYPNLEGLGILPSYYKNAKSNPPIYFKNAESNALLANIEVLIDNEAIVLLKKAYQYDHQMRHDEAFKCLTEGMSKMSDVRLSEAESDLLASSLFRLAQYYADGLGGCEKNPEMAFNLAKGLADVEDMNGKALLGRCYAEGIGVPQDKTKAMQLLTEAKDNDLAKSYFGIMNNNLEIDVEQIYYYLKEKKIADDAYVYFWLAEKNMENLLKSINEPDALYCGNEYHNYTAPKGVTDILRKLKGILVLYCKAWVLGYEVAGERAMDIRFGGNSQFANELNAIYQLPVYKYTEQIKKIRDNSKYNWGQLLITDLAGNPLYCIQDYYTDVKPQGAKHGVVELECLNDYWLQYVKGKWSQVPKDKLDYRRIRLNLDKIIAYKLDKYSSTEPPLRRKKLYSIILPDTRYVYIPDYEWNEYVTFAQSVYLKEYYYNRNNAIQDMRDAVFDGTDVWNYLDHDYNKVSLKEKYLRLALLKAMSEGGIEQAIERYERLMLNNPDLFKK